MPLTPGSGSSKAFDVLVGRLDRPPPREADRYFWCELSMWHQGRLRTFRFSIDDATSPSHTIVVAAEEVPD